MLVLWGFEGGTGGCGGGGREGREAKFIMNRAWLGSVAVAMASFNGFP